MKLRGKVFHKNNKRVYSCLNIDFINCKIDVMEDESNKTFDFKEVDFLESTGIKGNKSFIYRNDLIIAIKEKDKFKGIVKRRKDGCFYLHTKKLNLNIDIEKLIEQGFTIINLGNAAVYFEKLKVKRNKK